MSEASRKPSTRSAVTKLKDPYLVCRADGKRMPRGCQSGWWGGRRLEAVRAVFHQSVWKVYGNRIETGSKPDRGGQKRTATGQPEAKRTEKRTIEENLKKNNRPCWALRADWGARLAGGSRRMPIRFVLYGANFFRAWSGHSHV
jgi:hypothetical protein